jgi:hypothetical protein
MKSKILTIVSFIILSSCEDFLEVAPETVVASSNFYQSRADFEQAVTGTYAPLQPIYQADWMLTELRSDNTYFVYDIGNRGSKPIEDIATFTVETNNGVVRSKWLNNYLIIARVNEVLTKMDAVNFEQEVKDNLKGQSFFLRALAYFDLVKNFGGVPLFLETPNSYAEAFKQRSPAEDIYDQIISDANAAIDLLPAKDNQQPGRATSGAARTLLADVFLTLQRWAEVESILKPVLNMGYSLLPEYADIYDPSNEGNNEIVFEIEYAEGTSQPLHSSFPYSFLPELSDPSVITGVGPASSNGGGGFNIPTPEMLNAYEDKVNDRRYSASIAFYSGASPLQGVTYNNLPYTKKYLHPHNIPFQTGQNWIMYRYAEVLLMFAESLNEQGKPGDALAYINQVRRRAGLSDISSTNQSVLRDMILQERRIEFAFENKRWHDLVRTGRAVDIMNAFGTNVKANPSDYYYAPGNAPFPDSFTVSQNDLVYPIPVTEIVINPDLEQNSGY